MNILTASRARSLAAVLVGVAICNLPAPAGAAAPSPRPDEWWFRTWAVQDRIWPLTRGAGVTVAVIDGGVNAKLPELTDAVVPGVDLADHSTDGRVDLDTGSPGHGTATAAQIAGRGGGASGYVGLAPEAKILPIRLSLSGEDHTPEAIRAAVDHGAKVINMSYGSDASTMTPAYCSPDMAPAIDYALRHDVVLVASAGNEGDAANYPSQPASCPGVLAVGALTKQLRPWWKTERQSYVTVAAPGADVSLLDKRGIMHMGDGTSSAAALTSAAIALIRSKNPGMPARTIVQRIFATARPTGTPAWNNRTGYGLLNLSAVIDPEHHPVSAAAPNPLYDGFDRWQRQLAALTASPKAVSTSGSARQYAEKPTSSESTILWIAVPGTAVACLVCLAAIAFLRYRKGPRRGRAGT
ncbi:S8 family serine peptidase [Actinomadura rupiterrae]|uniref:S8 family serine peptidase n=1 Tax=Actinomadura rupiterrae TaxID=559627 RepID=UPI0020A46CB3|nr:S8 family serine peptidase [Actinomadura rupiterrae]MCP2337347.1 subtilisin family serine protease [Actinomadura rupiterrae]